MNEALVVHDGAKELIQKIGGLKPAYPIFAADIRVLSEQIGHQVHEEETGMFPSDDIFVI